MKDEKFFIDTNIFVYSFDDGHLLKQKNAKQLIEHALISSKGVISYQVVQEFINVSSKKFSVPMSSQEQKLFLHKVLMPLCEIYPDKVLYEMAIELSDRYQFSFYDSLIVASALQSDCKILYSEDLQHGQSIFKLKIINPFK